MGVSSFANMIRNLTMRPNTVREAQKHMYKQYMHGVESFRAQGTADMPANVAAAVTPSLKCVVMSRHVIPCLRQGGATVAFLMAFNGVVNMACGTGKLN